MRVRRYVVKKLEDAKPAILRDLGKDAIIISTNKVKLKGFMGLLGKYQFEVLAASDGKSTPNQPIQKPVIKQKTLLTQEKSPIADSKQSNELELIKNDLMENKKLLQNLLSDFSNVSTEFPQGFNELYKLLLSQGIVEEKSKRLITTLQKQCSEAHTNLDRDFLVNKLKKIIIQELDEIVCKDINTNEAFSIALVGPTGVGKTTTLAKIAAHSALHQHKKVGFITLDNYRIAAAEQLKIYGDILDVPVVVANTIAEYEEAIQSLNDREQVFIDTAGRSHRNTEQLLELKRYFDKLALDTILLVFSVTTNFKDLLPIYNTFKIFEPKGLILSKLDETETYGNIYNIVSEFRLPVFYLTTGQNVPEDITSLNSEQIANNILGLQEQTLKIGEDND